MQMRRKISNKRGIKRNAADGWGADKGARRGEKSFTVAARLLRQFCQVRK